MPSTEQPLKYYEAVDQPVLCGDVRVLPGRGLTVNDLAVMQPGDQFFIGDQLVTITDRRPRNRTDMRFTIGLPDDCLTVS